MQFTDFLVLASVGVARVPILSAGFACLFTRLRGKSRRLAPGKTPADYGLPFESVSFSNEQKEV